MVPSRVQIILGTGLENHTYKYKFYNQVVSALAHLLRASLFLTVKSVGTFDFIGNKAAGLTLHQRSVVAVLAYEIEMSADSAILPSLRTMILSARMTVARRWAITKVVRSRISRSSASWTRASLSASR